MTILKAAALAVFLSAGLIGALTPGLAQGTVKDSYGAWQMRCEAQKIGDQPPREQCALVQSVVDDAKPQITLVVIMLKTSDQKSRILRVVAPLNILLPSGLGLKIDDKEIGRAGFVRCLTTGCVAEVVMDDALLGQLRSGKTATFIIFPTPDEGIGIPVALEGFGAGFDALP